MQFSRTPKHLTKPTFINWGSIDSTSHQRTRLECMQMQRGIIRRNIHCAISYLIDRHAAIKVVQLQTLAASSTVKSGDNRANEDVKELNCVAKCQESKQTKATSRFLSRFNRRHLHNFPTFNTLIIAERDFCSFLCNILSLMKDFFECFSRAKLEIRFQSSFESNKSSLSRVLMHFVASIVAKSMSEGLN